MSHWADRRYNQLKSVCRDLGKESLDSFETNGELVEAIRLKRSLESLERVTHRIIVVGEVSAGKSCFVNALLGHDWLPLDVRQCTSAVVLFFTIT